MPKLTALKLLETSILPLIIVAAVKLTTTFLLSFFSNSPWTFVWENPAFRYYLLGFDTKGALLAVSNWSDLLTVLFIAAWFSWLIFKTNFLVESRVHPNLSRRLHQSGLAFLIAKEQIVYQQLVVWLVIVWVYLLFLTVNFVNGYTSPFVYGIGLALFLVVTAELFVFDNSLKS